MPVDEHSVFDHGVVSPGILVEAGTMTAPMRRSAAHAFALPMTIAIVLLAGARAEAQDPPPPIPRLVVDLRGSFPRFPRSVELASSRGLDLTELPGAGFGLDAGIHLSILKWKAVTFGLGGLMTLGRAHASAFNVENQPIRRAVTQRFTSLTPQLSLNFGTGDGWSYISGGIGRSTWTVVPEGGRLQLGDEERLRTINYGGGARWFIKRHVAFTFDVRFHDRDPGMSHDGLPGTPRARLIVIGAGMSIK
jgi:hypothetical protein